MEFGLRPLAFGQWWGNCTVRSTEYAEVCPKRWVGGATVQMAVGAAQVGGPKRDGGQGPGAKHQLCSWVWLGQATQWWVGPSDTT